MVSHRRTVTFIVWFSALVLGLAACNPLGPGKSLATPAPPAATTPAQSAVTPSSKVAVVTPANPTAAPTQAAASTPVAIATPTVQLTSVGGCANPYFPVSAQATWTYANTSPMAPPSTSTRTLTKITSSGFTVVDKVTPDITISTRWNCQGGDLTMLESAQITAAQDAVQIDVTEGHVSGVMVPALLTAGKTWQEDLGTVGTAQENGTVKMIQQIDYLISCTAGGKESVTVPAGKFDAIKVACDYAMDTTTSIGGGPDAKTHNSITVTDWYVAGVGSVRTEKTGDIVESHVLTAYSIK